MKKNTQGKRLLVQIIAISIIGVVTSGILYSEWFGACCMDRASDGVGMATLPAGLIAMVIGDGVHEATSTDFTIGLIVEFLLLWGLIQISLTLMKRRNAGRSQLDV